MKRFSEYIFLISLIAFLGGWVFSSALTLGIHPDEGDSAIAAFDFVMQFEKEQGTYTPSLYNRSDFGSFLGYVFPIYFGVYEGPVSTYFVSLIFFIFGKSMLVFRLSSLFMGAGIILFGYLLLKNIFGKIVSGITVILLTINPIFVQAVLVGQRSDELLVVFLLLAGGVFMQKFLQKDKWYFIAAAFFLWGLGLWGKLMFLGFMPGLFFGFFFLDKEQKKKIISRVPFAASAFFAGAFGCIYNAFFGHKFLIPFLEAVFGKTSSGHNNLNITANLLERLSHFAKFIKGNIYIAVTDMSFLNPYADKFFYVFIFLLILMFVMGYSRKIFKWRFLGFLVVFYSLLFVCLLFVPLIFDAKHMLLFTPFCQLLIALSMVRFFQLLYHNGRHTCLGALAAIFLAFVLVWHLAFELKALYLQQKAIKENKTSYEFWSYCLYDAVDFMLENNIEQVYTASHVVWPASIAFLSKDKIDTQNFWLFYFRGQTAKKEYSLRDWIDEKKPEGKFYFLSAGTDKDKEVLSYYFPQQIKEIKSFNRYDEILILYRIEV